MRSIPSRRPVRRWSERHFFVCLSCCLASYLGVSEARMLIRPEGKCREVLKEGVLPLIRAVPIPDGLDNTWLARKT